MGAGIQAPLRPYEPLRLESHRRTCRGARAAHGMSLDVARQGLRMRVNPEMGDSYLQGIQRQADFLSDRFVSFASLRRRASGFAQRIQAAVAALALGSS